MTRLFVFIACAVFSWTAGADQFDGTRAVVRDVMYRENLPSVAVGIARNGQVIWAEAFGLADVERRLPATAYTLYSVASVSKPITATALMTLVERGAVDLDRPIDQYLGPVKLTAHLGNSRDATVRRVANHTAGLAIHHQFFYEDEGRPRLSMDEFIAQHGHIMAPPGEEFCYSNFGYGLLEYVIERVSGRSYADYLRDEVFAPLGMRAEINARPGPGANVAVRYGNDHRPLPQYDFDARGASAVFASVHDLLRFGMFHLGDLHGKGAPGNSRPILTLASLDAMRTPAKYSDKPGDKAHGYGIGWGTGPIHGADAAYHTGGMAGVSAALRLIPAHDIAIAVLVNADSDRVRDIEKSIIESLLPETRDKTREFKPESPLVGTWRGVVKLPQRNLPVGISIEADGRVRVQMAGREPVDVPLASVIEQTLWLEYVPERFDLPQFERHPAELQFGLKQRGDRLTGQATTMARPLPDRIGDAISFYVEFERVTAP